jgi:DNA-directed RNA polymerase specialized sigma24 family protein
MRLQQKRQDETKLARFDQTIVPHLNAAYSLAVWLTRNSYQAEDVVQEACLNALPYRDIVDLTKIPLGIVMSRLSRARGRLEDCVKARVTGGLA